jgi:hypothetical protein
VIGTAIATFLQYRAGENEQNLARYKEDFASATTAFSEVTMGLQAATHLQSALFTNFSEAVKTKTYDDRKAFLTKSGEDLYKKYVDERLKLQNNIDLLARKVEIYIDWASDLRRDPSKASHGADLLGNSSVLALYDFDCAKNNPSRRKLTHETSVDIPHKTNPSRHLLRIDWNSAKHHVYSLYYCFEQAHEAIRGALQWGSDSAIDPAERARLIPAATTDGQEWREEVARRHHGIKELLDDAVERLTAFNTLSMQRIEQIRLRYRPKGFVCQTFGIRCGKSDLSKFPL